ncbi:MAG: hypothetical protein M0P09_02260 [Acholeplasmataceae bacterium]|nr:hypothetical protein [Acholeplasmataceae bacterium]
MYRNLIASMKNLFVSPDKKLEMKTREIAMKTTQDLDNLMKIIKDGEYAMSDHQQVSNDREQFLLDNQELQVDQNVGRNTDHKRAKYILWVVVSIASVLSVKGLRFFLGEFYATVNMLLVLPLAFFLAYFIVHGSIYINNFSSRYRDTNTFIYYQIMAFAYGMVLFIPAMNLLEGFNSNYRPFVMALNIVGCILDIILHTSLVSMSSVFTTAENSKKAIKIMRLKDKALAAADQKLRAFNNTFIKEKAEFTGSVKQFVSSFKDLQARNAEAAANTLLLLDNFTIWIINNRVMQHALIQYHANENGLIEIDPSPLTSEQNSMIQGWDTFSTVRLNNTNNQQTETLPRQRQSNEFPVANDVMLQPEQRHIEDTTTQEPEFDQLQSNPDDYDTILGNVNLNDKIL